MKKEIKILYSKIQLEKTAKFIALHNRTIFPIDDVIKSIHDCMNNIVTNFPNCEWSATMGFIVMAEVLSEESIDDDYNIVHFEFYVDPALASQDKNDIENICEENIII